MNAQNTHFKELNLKEKQSKLSQASREKVSFVLWIKGTEGRERVIPDLFFRESLEVLLEDDQLVDLREQELLYSFELNGVSFFGQGKLTHKDDKNSLTCTGKLFKSERRKNYRLLTYPHQKVFSNFDMETAEIKKSNLVSIRTKTTETGLFQNFLDLVREEDGGASSSNFRVLDLSVKGMALILGEFEKELLENKKELHNIEIKIDGEIVVIPRAQIRYVLDVKNIGDFSYKVGLEFMDVDINTDNKLGMLINRNLRESEDDFEDFIE